MVRWAAVVAAAGILLLPLSAAGAPRGAGGGTLVFYSNRTVDGGLYAVRAAGGPLRLLTHGVVDPPRWSPNGRYLAYLRHGTSGATTLWIRSADGRVTRLLAHDAGGVTWAPGGRALAFSRADRIWVERVDGSGLHALTTPPAGARDGRPEWSPDGSRIAFLRAPGGLSSALMTVRPTGRGLHRVAMRVFETPSWSPAGRRIAFDSSGPNGVGPFDPRLYVSSPDGTHRHNLVALNGSLAWSPNGAWIAYADGGLFVIHPDGTGRRRLVGPDSVSQPEWAPNSASIAVERGRESDVWVVGLNGAQRRVTFGWRYGYFNGGAVWRPRSRPPERLAARLVPWQIPPNGVVVNGVLEATQPIVALAADANRVAMTYAQGRCIETWRPATGVRIHFPFCNLAFGAMTMPEITRVAVAGPRVAWGFFEHALGTNSYGVFAATLSIPNPHAIAGLCSTPSGTCIRAPAGDLVGSGSLLAFDSWVGPEPYCNLPCPPPKRDGRLYRIDGNAAVQIASSQTGLTPLDVDNGRILVDEGSGELAVVSTSGATLATVSAPGFSEARLQGADLVARIGGTIVDYDAATGLLVHTWPAPPSCVLEDVQGGIAVCVSGTAVHLLRLADGRDASIVPPGAAPFHAQLQPAGLFYSYTVSGRRPGRVAFVPSSALP